MQCQIYKKNVQRNLPVEDGFGTFLFEGNIVDFVFNPSNFGGSGFGISSCIDSDSDDSGLPLSVFDANDGILLPFISGGEVAIVCGNAGGGGGGGGIEVFDGVEMVGELSFLWIVVVGEGAFVVFKLIRKSGGLEGEGSAFFSSVTDMRRRAGTGNADFFILSILFSEVCLTNFIFTMAFVLSHMMRGNRSSKSKDVSLLFLTSYSLFKKNIKE